MAKEIIKGNVAVAEAALRGGCNFFAGYPITPSTEALEYLSERMKELGLGNRFIQSENEIAAINMIMAATAVGARALTASSGPGISLKAEGLSYAARSSLPIVMLNVQRWGVGLGSLDSGQSDYYRDCKGGGHGDYHHIVYAPSSIQEMVDDIYEAWDIAEKYRVGVTILSEAVLGQMMEGVELPPFKSRDEKLPWNYDGSGTTVFSKTKGHKAFSRASVEKYALISREMQRWEAYRTEDAEDIFVAFGLPARVCIDAVDRLRGQGFRVGLLRPKILWPFPFDAFRELKETGADIKSFISIESNDLGQMVDDVALAAKKARIDVPVYCYAHSFGVPMLKEIVAYYTAVRNGEEKERF